MNRIPMQNQMQHPMQNQMQTPISERRYYIPPSTPRSPEQIEKTLQDIRKQTLSALRFLEEESN